MVIEKRTCESCDEEIASFVVFECNNPDCDNPQHTVCIADFLYIQIGVQELVSGR